MTMVNTQYSPNATIRAVEAKDIDAIKEIIDANKLFPSLMLDNMLKGYLTGVNLADRWLTATEGSPLAVAYYTAERMTEGTWNILLIAVQPEHQYKGFGTKLLRFIENRLRNEKQRLLIVETSGLRQFESVRRFYENYGFFREAVVRDFYEAGEDKVIYIKVINR